MSVQHDIDVLRRLRRGDVDQTEVNAVAREIDHEGPRGMAVAIPAHNRDRQTDRIDFLEQRGLTNVSKMPDFIRTFRQTGEVRRQVVMRVGDYQDAHREIISRRLSNGLMRGINETALSARHFAAVR